MNNSRFHYLAILAVCFFGFFINNLVVPADLMESRNLATAQEMVRTGNYLVPTMNGELRLEKPPLPTWIAAGVEHLAPGNLMAQRFIAGIMATVMVFFLYLLVVELSRNRKAALFSALVLATSFNVILMGRTATWDIYCHSFMLGAIYFLVLALRREGAQWKYFLLAGTFMGLSFLSKGPVSFYALLLSFLIGYGITYRPSLKGKVLPLICMVVLCLAISSWWTIYLLLAHPEMMLHVAHKESSSWINHNVRPWYYYWQFPAEAGIWALFLVTAMVSFFSRKRRAYQSDYTFAFVWLVSSLVLLSVIPEKKTRYLLPILVPAAMLVGLYVYYAIKNLSASKDRWMFSINATLIAVILFAIPIALYMMFYRSGQISVVLFSMALILSWGLSVYTLYATYGKKGIRVQAVFAAVVLSMMMIEVVCLNPIGNIFINSERKSIRQLRQHTELEGLPFFYDEKDGLLRMELVYEANQIIREMDITDNSQIYKHSVFVFVSEHPADSLFAGKDVAIENVGVFDNNWRKTGHKRYNRELVRHVAVIKTNQPSATIIGE